MRTVLLPELDKVKLVIFFRYGAEKIKKQQKPKRSYKAVSDLAGVTIHYAKLILKEVEKELLNKPF